MSKENIQARFDLPFEGRQLDSAWLSQLDVTLFRITPENPKEPITGKFFEIFSQIDKEGLKAIHTNQIGDSEYQTDKGNYKFPGMPDYVHDLSQKTRRGNRFLELYFDLYFNHKVHLTSCNFFPVRAIWCSESMIEGYNFFIAFGTRILKEEYSITVLMYQKDEEVPQFEKKEDSYIWSYEKDNRTGYNKLMYDKFFKETEFGQVIYLGEHGIRYEDVKINQLIQIQIKATKQRGILIFLCFAILALGCFGFFRR